MVDRIRRFQVLNSQIFSMLNKYMSSATIDSNQVEQIKCFNPPAYPKQGMKTENVFFNLKIKTNLNKKKF